ncbi:hypothetical protein AXA65_12435 [Chryseobacterium sp. FP211-J200]|nr:hypothetical protein AXA65_12435 [Chryseobacterium sp. FP211-J200]
MYLEVILRERSSNRYCIFPLYHYLNISLNDKERMDVVDRVYKEVKEYHNLVRYYTNKNISVSYLRAKKQNNTQRVLDLYGTSNQKYW